NNTCDLPICEDSSTFDVLKDHLEILSDSNNDDTSSDDDAFEDIEYVEALRPDSELVILEEENDVYQEDKEFDLEDILQIQDPNVAGIVWGLVVEVVGMVKMAGSGGKKGVYSLGGKNCALHSNLNVETDPTEPPPAPLRNKGSNLEVDNLALEGVTPELAPSDFVSQNYETLATLISRNEKRTGERRSRKARRDEKGTVNVIIYTGKRLLSRVKTSVRSLNPEIAYPGRSSDRGDLAMVVLLEHLMLLTRPTLFDADEPFVVAVHGVWRWWSVGDVGLDRLRSSVTWRGRFKHLQPRQMHPVFRLLAYLRCQNALTEAEIVRELAWQIVTFAATADASCLSIASLPGMSECTNGGKDYHKRIDRSCPYVSLDDVVVHSHRSLCYQEREW
nr:reverse transcriptase domain-containing protein [Tanacetum cinerariifolium]